MKEVSLSDTAGLANPVQMYEVCSRALDEYPDVLWNLHLHDTRGMGLANILAAMQAGMYRFDASLGGLGGCPFIPNASGNIATEDLVYMLREMGVETGIDLETLLGAAREMQSLIGRQLPSALLKTGVAPSRKGGTTADEPELTLEEQQTLQEMMSRARKAQAILENYDQEAIDDLCRAVAWEISNKRTFSRLVILGVEESRMGDPVTRMNKRMKIWGILRDALRQKSVGIIEEIPEKGIVKYAKPVGVIASLVPTTNPELTPGGQAVYAIKARDAIIFAPHPRAKKTTWESVEVMRNALRREGAPEDLLQCIPNPSLPLSQALMAAADLTIATGSLPMVKAAYSSGKPAYASGAGNATVIFDETADVKQACLNTMLSKTSDFGSGCSADGNLIVHESIYGKSS